jgi:hypothetical protein
LLKRSLPIICLSISLAVLGATLPAIALTINFNLPKRGLPGRREGGGTRGNELVAILPKTNLGLTTAAYPRFFWAVPKGIQATVAEFTLYQGTAATPNAMFIYRTTFRTAEQPGIASLKLPSDLSPPLAIGQDYHWTVTVATNLENLGDPQRSFKVSGWVQRVEPDQTFTDQLKQTSPRDRAGLYAANGYWFDTLEALAQVHCQSPSDAAVQANWSMLMKAPGVELSRQVAGLSLLQSCGAASVMSP